jgi:hypothetical protein
MSEASKRPGEVVHVDFFNAGRQRDAAARRGTLGTANLARVAAAKIAHNESSRATPDLRRMSEFLVQRPELHGEVMHI